LMSNELTYRIFFSERYEKTAILIETYLTLKD
jgi:hypothetical protein